MTLLQLRMFQCVEKNYFDSTAQQQESRHARSREQMWPIWSSKPSRRCTDLSLFPTYYWSFVPQRVVTDAEGANLAKTINSKFMGTSALQRLNVHESFEELAKETLELKQNTEPEKYSGDNESHSNIQLDSRSSKKNAGNKSSKCL
jgi:predicted phosphoadenosine phosphosulfate sulfurtransferase